MISLYDDQIELIEQIREELRGGSRSVLAVASTGFGKTMVSAFMAKEAAAKGKRVWFLCHLKNLLNQTSKAFWSLHIEHGLIASGKRNSPLPVQVGTIGTAVRRLDDLQAPDLLIVDEAHLAMAATWVKVIDWAKANGSIIVGNSATPERLDGKGLGYLFDSMTEARPMRWLIDQGRLSDYVIYSTAEPLDTSGLRTRAGDFATDQAEELMNKPKLIGDAASHWKRYANGLRTIAYCVTIKHSKATAAQFNAAGIPAIHVDGETPEAELKEAIQGFADGRYMVLCNVQLMTTGFDLSAQVNRDVPIEACIIMRPTKSVALYMQMVGRALRRKPRPAVILDHAGCVLRHGLPDDERDWSLEGRKKGSRRSSDDEPDVNVTQCKQCYAIFRTGPDSCPMCGAAVEVKAQRDVEVADGELVRVDVAAFRKQQRMEQGKARGLRDLVGLGLRRGMKNPAAWAVNVSCAREGRKPGPADWSEARRVQAELAASVGQKSQGGVF